MATVFLAVARGPAGFNKLTVVKCLRPSLAAETEFLEMFLAEARLAARVNHPNVVQTNEVGYDENQKFYYIAMEYVDGPSLESITRKAAGNMPVNLLLHVIIHVLHGLHHAHELADYEGKPLNVVHRDVSPHNVMVSYDGHVKLLDFGIAKAADSSGNTRTGILKGKCAYMAPEQFGGQDVDRRADVFAAGVILWQSLTGRKLWQHLSDAEIFSRLSRGEIPSPTTVKPDLPQELVDITMKALQPHREERYASAADFCSALEEFVKHHPEYAATPRDLATAVSNLFATERAKMKETVEAQLREVAIQGESLVSFSSTLQTPASAVAAPAPPKSKLPLILGGLAIVAIAGIGLVATRGRTTAAAAAAAANVAAPQTKVSIKVSPETAKIFFDDAPVAGNPAVVMFQRDGLSHRVRAEAPGFVRKNELVVLDSSDVSVEIDLEAENAEDEVDPFGNKLTAVTFTAVPDTSRLFIDNVLLPTNPSTAKFPRDGKEHTLRAEAPGYLTKSQAVKFEVARLPVTITLAKDPQAAAAAAAAAAYAAKHPAKPAAPAPKPAEAPAPAAAPAPAPEHKPAAPAPAPANTHKALDRSDPYAN